MKKHFKKIFSLLLCLTMVFSLFQAQLLVPSAKSVAEWNAEINKLKKEQANEKAILDALRGKINAINAQIAAYNQKINGINSTINANKAQIKKNEQEIEGDKLAFKKRIRSIYMSSSDSSVRVLLGAESFSEFLQLSQLTASVSSHDKRLMEDLVAKIKVLNEKNEENQKLLDEQIALKEKVAQQQAELKSDEASAASIYNKTTNDIAAAQKQLKAEEERIRQAAAGSGSAKTPSFVNNSGAFLWPVAGFYSISAGYQSNDSVHNGKHNGIDIAGGGISGAPIRAISDGYVSLVSNNCTHNYKKNGSCGCGGGYGNYCVINHGTVNGATYSAYYAHAAKIIVSAGQKVTRGQVIGYVGTTGWSTGYHLHLGLMRNGSWVNPTSVSYAK